MRSKARVVFVGLIVLLHGAAVFAAVGDYYGFDSGARDWFLAETGERLIASPDAPDRRGMALELPLRFPREASAECRRKSNWLGCDTLSFLIYLPPDAPYDVQVLVYIVDVDYHWYQSLHLPYLQRGRWNRIEFDISDNSRDWEFVGHFRPWDGYVKQQIRLFGIRLFSRKNYEGRAFIDDVEIKRSGARILPPQRLINFRTNANKLERYAKFEITFNLSRTYSNPFDPEQIDIRGNFVSPSGKVTTVPAFYYQNYVRDVRRKTEHLIPVGRGEWKIRFTPTEAGTYRYCIEVIDSEYLKTAYRSFEVVPSNRRGFVRISKRDPNYFEFDNGEFYYPIGHNICATFDVRNAANLGIELFYDRGTSAYDRYIDGMMRGKENLARIWMCAWNLALEWSPRYKPHYRGLGRYSLENAWRLDYILERAEKAGIYVMITFDTHGHWITPMSIQAESDWAYNPYNIVNGGMLSSPGELFINEEAKKFYLRRLRYILARWGYSTAVLCWEIFNEIDLAHEYYRILANRIVKWEVDVARYIKRHDQGKHIVTTNRYFWDKAFQLWTQPEIEFTNAHFFGKNPIVDNKRGYLEMKRYGKIFLVTESAQDVYGGSPEETERFMHTTLWSSYMLPLAGVAMPWWWDFIDERDLYFHFRALSNFAEGEDRRGKNLNIGNATVLDGATGQTAKRFRAECLQNDRMAYLWIYDVAMVEGGASNPPKGELDVMLMGLADGEYEIEFWDTYRGTVIGRVGARSDGRSLRFRLPRFEKDIACKVRPVSK